MKKFLLLSLFCAGLYSCEQKAPSEQPAADSTTVNAVTLIKELSVLQDSMNYLLTEIHELDTAKLAQQKRVLAMLNGMHISALKAELKAAENLIKNIDDYPGMEVMVKAQSILSSYDSDCDTLLSMTSRMLSKVQKTETLNELEAAITEKDNRSMVLRFTYDEIAQRYNLILEKHQELLMKSDSLKYGKTIPLFKAS